MIEIDPYYVDVAIARFEKMTEIRAVHVESGLTFEAIRLRRAAEDDDASRE